MGTGPEMPRLAELAKNAEPSDLGEREALLLLGGTNTNDLPAPWPYVIHDALRRRSMRDITTLAMVINGPKATMALRHCDEFHQTHEIVLGFESHRLVEVGVGAVDVAALEEGKC